MWSARVRFHNRRQVTRFVPSAVLFIILMMISVGSIFKSCYMSVAPEATPVLVEVPMMYEALPDKARPDEWRVEAIDDDGKIFVTVFYGKDSKQRAQEYARWKNIRLVARKSA